MIMKKVLMFMAIMIAVVSLSSCGSLENNEDCLYSYKSSTKVRKSLKELSKRLDSLAIDKKQNPQLSIYLKAEKELRKYHFYGNNITNKKIILLNDSMCTISFIYKDYDDSNLGRYLERYSQSKFEYTFVKLRKGPVKGTTIYSSIFLPVNCESINSIQKTIDYINNGFPHDLLEDVLEGDVFKLLKKTYNDNIKKGMSKEDAKANCLYIRAIANSDTYGKEITL